MRKRSPVVDRTYRIEDGRVNYWKEAARLMGGRVVVYVPSTGRWKSAYLVGLLPARDTFFIRWTKRGRKHAKQGIWRVHKPGLFRLERAGQRLLPTPIDRSKLPQSTTSPKEGNSMATKPASKAKPKPKAKPAAASNGAATRTTNDKLAGLTEVKRRNIAKFITKERGKKPATSWPDITAAVKTKYDWDLPGSMTGRRLMREYGPDGAEEAIIKQERDPSKPRKSSKKAKLTPAQEALAGMDRTELKALNKDEELGVKVLKSMDDDALRAAIAETGWEPATDEDEEDEELEEDEDSDEEEEDTEEDEEEDTEDEADEDEEEEEPEPVAAKPKRAAKKVAVKRSAKPKPNPSK